MAGRQNRVTTLWRQQGGVALIFALSLTVLLACTALAVDLARVHLVRAELQNAADAAALAGVLALSQTDPPPDEADRPYNWTAASASALEVARQNSANAAPIEEALVTTGYWNLQEPSLGLRAAGASGVPQEGDMPAVRVELAIAAASNGGPLQLWFAPLLGIGQQEVRARAMAMLPAAGSATALFPVVISSCMYNHFWDFETRRPKLDPATGEPYRINIGSIYFEECLSGEWTTFTTQDNDVPTVQQLIEHGNPLELGIGDSTWVQTGVKTSIYDDVPLDADVAVLVVDAVTPGSWQPIAAIAGFHISGTVTLTGKRYIQGHFLENLPKGTTNAGSGTGTPLGAYAPPVLID